MGNLVEKALKDIVENRITKEEIWANKVTAPPPTETPSIVSVAEEGPGKELKLPLPPDDDDEEEKKKPKKKKKD